MRKQLADLVKKFARDERGASLLEYTILIGIITVAVIGSIATTGTFVSTKWTALTTALQGK
jgi:pilus assembly protein Flp/PilA